MKTELVTNLKRHATKILGELHVNKEPILITEHGQPSAYLVDVEDYEYMQNRLALLEAIALGEKDIAEGNTHTQAEVEAKLGEWLR